jgi:hypothetical protein
MAEESNAAFVEVLESFMENIYEMCVLSKR